MERLSGTSNRGRFSEHSLPNVFIAIGDKELVPDGIRQGLRAVSWDDPWLQSAADYRPQDIVFWL